MLHVLEDHDEWVTITTHAIKLDNVLMLQVGEQLCLPLEVLAGCQGGVFQCLKEGAQIHTGWAQVGAKPEHMGRSVTEELMRKGREWNHCHWHGCIGRTGGRCRWHHLGILFM